MAENLVETTQDVTPDAHPAPSAAPSGVPATPATPDFEAEVNRRVEQKRRELQAAKDRELAAIRRQQQAHTQALIQQAQAQVAQYSPEAAAALPQAFVEQAELAEYRAGKEAAQAAEADRVKTQEIVESYGLKFEDPRLWQNPPDSWAALHAVCKNLLAQDARAERQRLKEEAEAEARAQVDGHVQSGALTTLTAAPAGSPNKAARAEELYAKLYALMAGVSTKAQRDAVKAELRAVGEDV